MIDQLTLDRLIEKKKELIEMRIKEYNKLFARANCTRSIDFENIADQSLRYSTVLAKLEGELQQLEDLQLYV